VELDAKFVPVTVTVSGPPPTIAELGLTLMMLGGGGPTVKVTALLVTPPTITVTFPVIAPGGTSATIAV